MAEKPKVVTAKVPDWLFEAVEQYKNDYDLRTRNAAVSVLLSIGLSSCKRIEPLECKEFLRSQGMGIDLTRREP